MELALRPIQNKYFIIVIAVAHWSFDDWSVSACVFVVFVRVLLHSIGCAS